MPGRTGVPVMLQINFPEGRKLFRPALPPGASSKVRAWVATGRRERSAGGQGNRRDGRAAHSSRPQLPGFDDTQLASAFNLRESSAGNPRDATWETRSGEDLKAFETGA